MNSSIVLSVIQDTDINNAEKYVCEKLPNILKDRSGKILNKAEKTLIFGKNHAMSPNTFSFTPREKILIRQVSEYLKKNTLPKFTGQMKRENYSAEKTVLTCLGIVFGSEADLRLDTEKTNNITITSAKKTLLQKAKDKLKEFDAAVPFELTEEMIFMDDSDPSNIKGQVKCVYCNEHMAKVSAKYLRSSYSWVMSNLTTNLKSCQRAIKTKNENEAKARNVQPAAEDDEVLEVKTAIPDGEAANPNPLSIELRKQMYIQNMKMKNSVFQNNETKTECEVSFEVGESTIISAIIDVCKIQPDGNCLFSAVTHQLYGCKIDSPEHTEKTQELRFKVVDHIRNNISSYNFELKGRIYEKYGKIDKSELNGRFIQYLDVISIDGRWAGNESLVAMSDMMQKNIVIFNEKIHATVATKFDPTKKETIMLAFRLGVHSSEDLSNLNRNHYDSVVAINSDDILKETSKSLIEKQLNPFKMNTDTVVLD